MNNPTIRFAFLAISNGRISYHIGLGMNEWGFGPHYEFGDGEWNFTFFVGPLYFGVGTDALEDV